MKKPTLFGLEITLTCPKCQKECLIYDFKPDEGNLVACIQRSMTSHQIEDICEDTSRGTLYLGGKTFTIEEKKP
ncbi:hypothetical protein LCGC14_3011210 [marine sediment metagenome]|uniref:Uncharacterized protein n=1 Tax=marine sediment metagenome TaxID=412755 RepID=A0A0F8XKX7_9ZZZZ